MPRLFLNKLKNEKKSTILQNKFVTLPFVKKLIKTEHIRKMKFLNKNVKIALTVLVGLALRSDSFFHHLPAVVLASRLMPLITRVLCL